MDTEQRKLAKELFLEAMRREPKERNAFLATSCGEDDALLAEVESLLKSHEESGGFLNRPPIALGAASVMIKAPPPRACPPPESIGPYKILKVLGEGGMGVVYLAEQTRPVIRQVALKVIKLGMDTREVAARFDLERQALAMMNHSNIAHVYEAGTTEQGQPFFIMEYVPGLPITEYCDQHRLNTRERLALFIQVCDAVQHAHQKGIIHRDLKPSNVLVTVEGDKPRLKIIDFGVARAADKSLALENADTLFGSIIGTPEYMSPEQAEIGAVDIDTRADIYTLGVHLYELLTGKLPFEFPKNGSMNYSDIQRRIGEEVPLRPSQRVECRILRRHLQGDLDWIIMKALEKERRHRYASASELSAEINRHLRNEPVLAGPPSAIYLLKKFVSKNKRAVTAVIALVLTLAAGLTVSTYLYSMADTRLGDYRNLADLFLIESYIQEADELWPARPEMIPAMEAWLAKAERLSSWLEVHRAKLMEMREGGCCDETATRNYRMSLPQYQELQNARMIRKKWEAYDRPPKSVEGDWGGDRDIKEKVIDPEGYRDYLDKEIARLNEEIATYQIWTFRDPEEQWLHDKLTLLVKKLDLFISEDPNVGVKARIQQRIIQAREIRRKTVEENADAWRRAIESIADIEECPLYGGLKIKPQVGLLPLCRNPDSGLWEFTHLETGLVLVFLPGGTFNMGAMPPAEGEPLLPNRDPHTYDREGPVHSVTLKPFFLSKYEMTRAQWMRAALRNPGSAALIQGVLTDEANGMETHPVDGITWEECQDVLLRLGLELPTEAQWEYAAREGKAFVWPTGNEKYSLAGHANLLDNAALRSGIRPGRQVEEWLDDGYGETAPVGSFKPNAYGLYDMTGNVYEWCRDKFDTYECLVSKGDGERISMDDRIPTFILRGGSYDTLSNGARSSFRVDQEPTRRSAEVGVRPAMSLDG